MVGERADCPAWAEHSLTRKREGAVHAGQALTGVNRLFRAEIPLFHRCALGPLSLCYLNPT